MSFRVIAKLALLLVVIGFLMPITNIGGNGFKIAETLMSNIVNKTFEGLLTYLVFISAVAGVVIGALMLTGRGGVSSTIDWAVIAVCIASGLILYFGIMSNNIISRIIGTKLNNGAYFILAGWVISVGCQVFSLIKRE